MRRFLIVANQTLDSTLLADSVKGLIDAEESIFFVVAPATPLHDQVGYTAGPSPQDRANAVAQQRLNHSIDNIRALGAEADGVVGDPDPFEAVRLALGRFDADEVIVSTLPPALSRWLRRDLPGRISRAFHRPVAVVGEIAASPQGSRGT